jgi:hypothetical protein
MVGWNVQVNAKRPDAWNRNSYESPGFRGGDENVPSLAVTSCWTLSRLVHTTVVPRSTVIDSNVSRLIGDATRVAAAGGGAGVAGRAVAVAAGVDATGAVAVATGGVAVAAVGDADAVGGVLVAAGVAAVVRGDAVLAGDAARSPHAPTSNSVSARAVAPDPRDRRGNSRRA